MPGAADQHLGHQHTGAMAQRSHQLVTLWDGYLESLSHLEPPPRFNRNRQTPTRSAPRGPRRRSRGCCHCTDAATQTMHDSSSTIEHHQQEAEIVWIGGREYLALTVTRDDLFQVTLQFIQEYCMSDPRVYPRPTPQQPMCIANMLRRGSRIAATPLQFGLHYFRQHERHQRRQGHDTVPAPPQGQGQGSAAVPTPHQVQNSAAVPPPPQG